MRNVLICSGGGFGWTLPILLLTGEVRPYAGRCVALGLCKIRPCAGRRVVAPYGLRFTVSFAQIYKGARADEGIRPYGVVYNRRFVQNFSGGLGFIHNSTLLGRFVNRPYGVVHRRFVVQIFAGRRDADPYAGRCVAGWFVQNSTLRGRALKPAPTECDSPLSLCKI